MEQNNKITIPVAIIAAGIIIGGAIFLSSGNAKKVIPDIQNPTVDSTNTTDLSAMKWKDVDSTDHIKGNPQAPVKFVVYSDTECPYCKTFDATINKLTDKYGKNGTLAFVYRHFPLDSLHKKARNEAEALECAGSLGGNEKFFLMLDGIMQKTNSNDKLDAAELPRIANTIGINTSDFNTCLSSGKFAKTVQDDADAGANWGVRGTPNATYVFETPVNEETKSFVEKLNTQFKQRPSDPDILFVSADGQKVILAGALPFEIADQILTLMKIK